MLYQLSYLSQKLATCRSTGNNPDTSDVAAVKQVIAHPSKVGKRAKVTQDRFGFRGSILMVVSAEISPTTKWWLDTRRKFIAIYGSSTRRKWWSGDKDVGTRLKNPETKTVFSVSGGSALGDEIFTHPAGIRIVMRA